MLGLRFFVTVSTFFFVSFSMFSFDHSLSAFSISSTETLKASLESAETASTAKEEKKMSLEPAPHAVEWLECGAADYRPQFHLFKTTCETVDMLSKTQRYDGDFKKQRIILIINSVVDQSRGKKVKK